MVAEVAPAPFRGERFSAKIRREALQPKKLEECLPRPALAVDKEILEGDCMYERVALREAECPIFWVSGIEYANQQMTGLDLSTSVNV